MPSFFTFVSTGAGGEHVYGHCLTIYDLISPAAYAVLHSASNIMGLPEPEMFMDTETSDQHHGGGSGNDGKHGRTRRSRSSSNVRRQSIIATMYAPKCLCLITRYPFMSQCRDILTSLYRLVLSPLDVPIERYICNLMNEVPMPPSGMAKILYSIADKELIFTRPPVNRPIENIDLPFDKTFECLGIKTTLSVFKCLCLSKSSFPFFSAVLVDSCDGVFVGVLIPIFMGTRVHTRLAATLAWCSSGPNAVCLWHADFFIYRSK